MSSQWNRIAAIVGDGQTRTFKERRNAFYEHLVQCLELPEVTGIDDFRWEEPFMGVGTPRNTSVYGRNPRRIKTSTTC